MGISFHHTIHHRGDKCKETEIENYSNIYKVKMEGRSSQILTIYIEILNFGRL